MTRNRLILSAALFSLAVAGGVAAHSQTAARPATGGAERVRPDADGDGNLTRAEAMAAAAARFARMDANADGRIDAADREAGRERRREAMFARIDADGNGAISRAEFDAAGAAMEQRREARGEARAHRGGEHRRGPGGRAFRAGQRSEAARAADTNNDRAIDRAEFMAAAEARFARADADGNGIVSAAERRAMRPARRGASGAGGMMPPPPPTADNE